MFRTGLYSPITAGIRNAIALDPINRPGHVSDLLTTAAGLNLIASYANGIGPALSRIVSEKTGETGRISDLVVQAHARGLVVHPYNFAGMSCRPTSTILMNSFACSFLTSGLTEDLQIFLI
jgi:hypothetical protein